MFESILIRRHLDGPQSVDAGVIAEALLFYEHVHVVADDALLADLLRVIGPDTLLKMLGRNLISLTFVRETLGIITNTLPTGMQFHNLAAFEVARKGKNAPVVWRLLSE